MKGLVELRVKASLVSKSRHSQKLWSAVHSLITAAIEAENENEQAPDEEAEEGEVEAGEITGEVPGEKDKVMDEDIVVVFDKGFLDDPSGLWTDLLEHHSRQKTLEYEVDRVSVVGMEPEVAEALLLAQAPKPTFRKLNGCFNCGDTGHTVAQCKAPLDRRRIAEAREDQQSATGGGVRYHAMDKPASLLAKYPHIKQGTLSSTLRQHLGLGPEDPDPFVRVRQRLGPPPMKNDAVNKTNSVDKEPVLTMIDDASKESSVSEEEHNGQNEDPSDEKEVIERSKDQSNSSRCVQTGNKAWDSRPLPLCTCGTEIPCLRANPAVKPKQPSQTPPPLIASKFDQQESLYGSRKRGRSFDNMQGRNRPNDDERNLRRMRFGGRSRDRSPTYPGPPPYGGPHGMYTPSPGVPSLFPPRPPFMDFPHPHPHHGPIHSPIQPAYPPSIFPHPPPSDQHPYDSQYFAPPPQPPPVNYPTPPPPHPYHPSHRGLPPRSGFLPPHPPDTSYHPNSSSVGYQQPRSPVYYDFQ